LARIATSTWSGKRLELWRNFKETNDDALSLLITTLRVELGEQHERTLSDDEKADMIRELDAVVAHLYSLSESQLTHIFATFLERLAHTDRLRVKLKHFHDWEEKR
jgi:hypothetical protein